MTKAATGKKISRTQQRSRAFAPTEIYTRKRLAEFARNNDKALSGYRIGK
jgi:hypothetical protein